MSGLRHPCKQLTGAYREDDLSEVNLNLRYLGIKDWRVIEPGTTLRREWTWARTLTLVGRGCDKSQIFFSFWQNEEGFVKCPEEKKEIFDLSPYKNFSLIIITSCYRNGEEYIRTHPVIHLSTHFSDTRCSRLYQLCQILWTKTGKLSAVYFQRDETQRGTTSVIMTCEGARRGWTLS